jgi:group I intron endonuclease
VREIISGVYKITNNLNGKVYIGGSYDVLYRWSVHRNKIKSGSSHVMPLIEIQTLDDLSFEVIEKVTDKTLPERESYYIDLYKACDPEFGYNKRAKGCIGPKNNADSFRVSASTTVDPKLWGDLKQYSENSGIPISRILDKAISNFLETGREKR